MYNKRKITEKKLIKKLFTKMIINLKIDKSIPIKIRFKLNRGYCSCRVIKDKYNMQIKRQIIILDIDNIKYRTNIGYPNDYYNNRSKIINPHILHNRHNSIRFVLLHELKHAIDSRIYNDYNKWDYADREKASDSFGIDNIRRYI